VANPWLLYQRSPSFVLGFHGSDKATVDAVVGGIAGHLDKSAGRYEWLGHGIYFWENDPQRGLEWAQTGHSRKKAQDPDVVGAVIDLGRCLDLTTRTGLDEVAEAFTMLRDTYAAAGQPLPSNAGGKDKFKRELDCQVIQALHLYRQDQGLTAYDSVRAPFPEDELLYEGAGFRWRNHIQIAVINLECIKGYFRPLKV
jgi:hypothetical protein